MAKKKKGEKKSSKKISASKKIMDETMARKEMLMKGKMM